MSLVDDSEVTPPNSTVFNTELDLLSSTEINERFSDNQDNLPGDAGFEVTDTEVGQVARAQKEWYEELGLALQIVLPLLLCLLLLLCCFLIYKKK